MTQEESIALELYFLYYRATNTKEATSFHV
jgi:hypothetical protein